MKTLWILLVLLCLDQAQANFQHMYSEALTRSAVYHQVSTKCGQLWGEKITNLKANLKESLGSGTRLKKHERAAITVDPAEVAAITSHLCERGHFPRNLYEERSWYRENPTAAYVTEEESDTTNEILPVDTTSANMESEYLADTPYTSRSSSLFLQPYASFFVGLLLGICVSYYISLLKGGSSVGNTVSANKLRRTEL